MLRTSVIALSLSLALALPGVSAFAQAPLSLKEAVGLALAENPQLRAADRQVEAAKARETQAAALPNPNFTLQADALPFASPGSGEYMAGISQPLLLDGQRAAQREAAALDTRLAEYDREILRRDLAAQVRDAYTQVLYERAGGQLARANADSAVTMRKAVQARYKAGEVPQLEVLRSEVEESRAQREVEVAQNRLRQAEGRLNILLGREAQAQVAVQELAPPTSEQLPPLAPMVSRGLAERVELRQAEAAIAREALQRHLAQASLWTGTQMSLSAGASSGQPAIAGSLTIPVPFYRQQGEVAEAEANRLRAEARRDVLRNELTLEIDQAYRDAAIAAHQAILFAKSYVPQAERLLDNAQRRFLVGEGSGLEVVEARRAMRETRAEHQQSLLSYRQALSRLERAVGAELAF